MSCKRDHVSRSQRWGASGWVAAAGLIVYGLSPGALHRLVEAHLLMTLGISPYFGIALRAVARTSHP